MRSLKFSPVEIRGEWKLYRVGGREVWRSRGKCRGEDQEERQGQRARVERGVEI